MGIRDVFEDITYKYIDMSDWNDLIETVYGERPYHVQQQDFLPQDSVIFAEVPCDWLEEDLEENLEIWLSRPLPAEGDSIARMEFERESTVSVDALLFDLHKRGLVDEGKYLIHIWW